jgi:hypothetical protein
MAAKGESSAGSQEAAIVALLTQHTEDEAARGGGIGTGTLLRWLQVPEFQRAYREDRRSALGQAIARPQQGTSAAASTLLKTMIDPAMPASVKVARQRQSSITLVNIMFVPAYPRPDDACRTLPAGRIATNIQY